VTAVSELREILVMYKSGLKPWLTHFSGVNYRVLPREWSSFSVWLRSASRLQIDVAFSRASVGAGNVTG